MIEAATAMPATPPTDAPPADRPPARPADGWPPVGGPTPPPPVPRPAVPLDYADHRLRRPVRWDWRIRAVAAFRRLAFAVGAGLLAAGGVAAVAGLGARPYSDADAMAGWGAFLVALV